MNNNELQIQILAILRDISNQNSNYIDSEDIHIKEIENRNQIKQNIRYLKDKNLIDLDEYIDESLSLRINSHGIDYIEEYERSRSSTFLSTNQIKEVQENVIVNIAKYSFDVAFSFPGEVRAYVEKVIEELNRKNDKISYFYDNKFKAQLAQPSLSLLLQDLYKNRSELIVVFICEKYQEKEWCGIEFRAIQDILYARNFNKIMYIKMDDGEVSGVFKTDGYIDSRTHQPNEIAEFICQRVALLRSET